MSNYNFNIFMQLYEMYSPHIYKDDKYKLKYLDF